MNLMIDPHHIWNVIYNARSNRSHPPTSPNTASRADLSFPDNLTPNQLPLRSKGRFETKGIFTHLDMGCPGQEVRIKGSDQWVSSPQYIPFITRWNNQFTNHLLTFHESSWLVKNGILTSWFIMIPVVFHPLYIANSQGPFFHCSPGRWSTIRFLQGGRNHVWNVRGWWYISQFPPKNRYLRNIQLPCGDDIENI